MGDYHVLCRGSWSDHSCGLQVTHRYEYEPTADYYLRALCFRITRTLIRSYSFWVCPAKECGKFHSFLKQPLEAVFRRKIKEMPVSKSQ